MELILTSSEIVILLKSLTAILVGGFGAYIFSRIANMQLQRTTLEKAHGIRVHFDFIYLLVTIGLCAVASIFVFVGSAMILSLLGLI